MTTETPARARPESARIRSIDWHRGIAVVVMIQTHTLALLHPSLKVSAGYFWLQWMDGLVAPSFIFAAGFSLALVQVRGAASGRMRRLRRSLRRALEVLLVSAYMTWIWYPLLRQPKWLLRIDILSCIGLSLVVALPLFAALSRRPKLLSALGLALAGTILLASPYARLVGGPLADFFGTSTGSPFPLFPWAAYVFFGGVAGAATGAFGRTGLERSLVAIIATAVLLYALAHGAAAIARRPDTWIPFDHAQRLVVVASIALALVRVEAWAAGRLSRSLPVKWIEIAGGSSLAAYFLHEVLLFVPIKGIGVNAQWRASLGWFAYWAVTAALIVVTLLLTRIAGALYERADGTPSPRPSSMPPRPIDTASSPG